jgi:hypothetical protein
MNRLLCLLCLIFSILYVYGQDSFADTSNLQKYSYLIYGRTRSGCTVQATGVLVRSKNHLYLVTACHVINGWYFESYEKDDAYPDTLYLRVFKKKNDSVAFIPLDIRKLKHTKPAPHWPDSAAYQTNTLGALIAAHKSNILPPEEILVYGYHITEDSDNVDFTTTAVHRATASWTDQEPYSNDPYTYYIGYSGITLGPGDSGSPVYFIYKEKTGQIKLQFGGLIFGGAPSLHKAMVVRPEIIRNLLHFPSSLQNRSKLH